METEIKLANGIWERKFIIGSSYEAIKDYMITAYGEENVNWRFNS